MFRFILTKFDLDFVWFMFLSSRSFIYIHQQPMGRQAWQHVLPMIGSPGHFWNPSLFILGTTPAFDNKNDFTWIKSRFWKIQKDFEYAFKIF